MFDELYKNYTNTSQQIISYGGQFPLTEKIVYNRLNKDDAKLKDKALKDIDKTFGKAWSLYGIDSKNGEFNVLNNIISGVPSEGKKSIRTMDNCKRLRFLYEWDTISLQEQIKITKKLIDMGVLLRATYSGSKSIHHIIELWSIKEPTTKDEYKFLHDFIAKCLHLEGFDTQCKDNSRLTRKPQVFRKDKNKYQELIFYSNTNRFKCDFWYDYYLASKRQIQKNNTTQLLHIIENMKNQNQGADWKFVEGYIKSEERKGSFQDGNRHSNIGRIICALKLRGGLDCDEITEVLEPFIEDSTNNDLRNGIEKLYNGAE